MSNNTPNPTYIPMSSKEFDALAETHSSKIPAGFLNSSVAGYYFTPASLHLFVSTVIQRIPPSCPPAPPVPSWKSPEHRDEIMVSFAHNVLREGGPCTASQVALALAISKHFGLGYAQPTPVEKENLYVIFDGEPGPQAPHFVEVESEGGGSRKVEWSPYNNTGYWKLGPFHIGRKPSKTFESQLTADLASRYTASQIRDILSAVQVNLEDFPPKVTK